MGAAVGVRLRGGVIWSSSGPWTIASTAVHVLEAAGRRWRVTVALPETPAGSPSPVVYVLDPFGTLGVAVQVARITHLLSVGALPPLLVVGIGPDSDDLGELMQQRLNDLSPSSPASLEGPAAELVYGGGEAFLDLLLDEIAPYVEREHDGNPAGRTVAGWSLGGLLGAHTLVTRPDAFRRYLLVSPSLWWADAEVLTKVPALADHKGSLDVYLAAGDLEETAADRTWPPAPDGATGDARMVGNLLDFADSLRALRLEGVTVHSEVLHGEHHVTVWPAAFTRGLLALHVPGYRLVQ
jgi:predicted alpha/beta superfamily hydrolase